MPTLKKPKRRGPKAQFPRRQNKEKELAKLIGDGKKFLISNDVYEMAKLLARVGLKPWTIAQMLGIEPSKFNKYLEKNPDFAKELANTRLSVFHRYMGKMMEQAEKGYFPACQWVLERLFGDVLESNVKTSELDGKSERKVRTLTITVEEYISGEQRLKEHLGDEYDEDEGEDDSKEVKKVSLKDLGESIKSGDVVEADYEELDDEDGSDEEEDEDE